MNRRSLLPILIVILTSCVSSPSPSISTAKIETATAIPSTRTPTNTPIPTNTVEPTPTRDPSIPEGYEKDASGNYTKTENGLTITWDRERNAGYSLLFDNFLMDKRPALEGTLPDTLELKVFIDVNITNWEKLTVTHPENMDPTSIDGSGPQSPFDGNQLLQNLIWEKMVKNGMIKDVPSFSSEQWYKLGGYTRHYNTEEGHQTLILKDGYVTTVYIRADYEALKADQENNKFSEVVGSTNLGSPSIRYMAKISSDTDGNTIVGTAPSIIDALQWSDNRIIEMFLFGFSSALASPDDPVHPRAAGLSSDVALNKKEYPFFMITRQK
jgi:hypothetical protein